MRLHSESPDRDLNSIYEYLAAIPCLEGGPNEPANRCKPDAKTTAVAGPKSTTAVSRWVQLDGTKSSAANGGTLSFQWSIPQGSPQAAISGGATPTPTVQLASGRGLYTFLLTVTDTAGKSAMDSVTIDFEGN